MPLGAAGASVTVDLTMEMMSQIIFTLLGIALLVPACTNRAYCPGRSAVSRSRSLVILAFISAQRFGLFHLIERGLVKLAGRGDGMVAAGRHCRATSSNHRALCLAAAAHWRLQLPSDLVAAGGPRGNARPSTLSASPSISARASIIESLGQALRAVGFAIPASLGVQEGGYVLICGMLGISPQAAIELSLLKRIREVALGVPALIVWQILEARRLVDQTGEDAVVPVVADGD